MAIEEIRKTKIEKVKKLRKAGIDPYPAESKRTHAISKVLVDFDGLAEIAPRLGIDIGVVNNQSNIQPEEKSVLTEQVVKTAEDIDVASIKLEILNGTITSGLAVLWKEKFAGAGFLSDNIKTGNADKRNYSGITVYHNSVEAVFGKVSAVLNQGNSAIKTEKDEKLDNLSFRIIIGK